MDIQKGFFQQPISPSDRCGYTDSDWAGVLNGNRKSTSSYIFKLAGGPISRCSAKQPCVSLSSNEAEYVALSEAVRDEATWIRYIMMELSSIPVTSPIRILADNKGATDLTKVVAVTAIAPEQVSHLTM